MSFPVGVLFSYTDVLTLEIQILGNHLEPFTEQQLIGICNLQQSSQQAEDALSQGMEALQQLLVDTLSSTSLGPTGSGNVADYMGQMAIAMRQLATLESFLHQVTNRPLFKVLYNTCSTKFTSTKFTFMLSLLLGWSSATTNFATIASNLDYSSSCSSPPCHKWLHVKASSTQLVVVSTPQRPTLVRRTHPYKVPPIHSHFLHLWNCEDKSLYSSSQLSKVFHSESHNDKRIVLVYYLDSHCLEISWAQLVICILLSSLSYFLVLGVLVTYSKMVLS